MDKLERPWQVPAVPCGTLAALRLMSYNLLPPTLASTQDAAGALLGTVVLPGCPPPQYCVHPHLNSAIPPSLLHSPPLETLENRRRGEKRPIPAELKDEKYFERRRRNNQAAKKSRDARKIREDQIAWRACLLERENASLRAHVAALRAEALALRELLAHTQIQTQPSVSTKDDKTPDPTVSRNRYD